MGFLDRPFRDRAEAWTANHEAAPQTSVSHRRDRSSEERFTRREPPTELDWTNAKYVPLPPSPPTWEVDGRDEFHSEYDNPALKPVFDAGFKKQHAKVVRLAPDLSAEQRQDRLGDVIAKAYRKVIVQRMKAGQLSAAAERSLEMFEMVPGDVQDVDRRRLNRILDQMDKQGKQHNFERVEAASPPSQPLFAVSDDSGWVLDGERKLEVDERPDPAFKVAAIDGAGTWLLEGSKKNVARPDAEASLLRMNRHGQLIAAGQLNHDAYRVGVGSAGPSIAIMDSDGALHIYDAGMNVVVETDLAKDPRVLDHFRTIETEYWGEFKSQVRAVDISPESDRYLFTLADEAWCCTVDGSTVWGVVMPLNDGWERVVGRSKEFGVGHEVEDALRLFGLSLPVAPDDIKQKWRALALAHHPDRNPDEPRALEKMTAVNHAFEILTGVDPDTLSFEESDTTHFERSAPDHVIDLGSGVQITITMSTGVPQDWVYAASFAAIDGGAYIATYSGRVILLSREGEARVVFDIGICPSEIVDMGRYTYFLTATRLYVVEDQDKIAAFLDVYQQGRLIVSQEGFGLLTSKALQWFTLAGAKLGDIRTRDPIRAIYATETGAVVQTRRHQVEVRGLAI